MKDLEVGMGVKHECGREGTTRLCPEIPTGDFFTGHYIVMKDGKHYNEPNAGYDVIEILSEPEPVVNQERLMYSLGLNTGRSFEYDNEECLEYLKGFMNGMPSKQLTKAIQLFVETAESCGYTLHKDYEVEG